MSNQVSVITYSRKLGSPTRKAVMVYFAERASDNGEGIWASKSTMAEAIECGRSTVIRIINEFVSEGLLKVVGSRPCKNGSTVEYAIDIDALKALPLVHATSEKRETRPAVTPVPERDPSQSGTPPVPERDPYPSQSGTQTTIGTTNEPSGARAILCEVLSEETADSYIDHRKAKRAKLTNRAAELIVKKLKGHQDPNGVVEESIANGWTGVFPEKSRAGPSQQSYGYRPSVEQEWQAGARIPSQEIDEMFGEVLPPPGDTARRH
ncbi:helix-turn-helix domain-containing protein [Maritimibacter sp. UBA3975]|uniref:helix-turn-helix domain-containing protein n=1 Tax=Maritimibacter sp. UBA3975 TaxID=1946833 RepID=UPI000C0AF743|nr:helix-turn-helix domain-containing protein [Maritimibacter sp. UBA3975]MAM60846.1 hypothetical protein [Maritimibacter sp.]|tara:strand:+ start:1421 stop:2215 length:795 start_codon:yes stop_codon:yes gene_type:complete